MTSQVIRHFSREYPVLYQLFTVLGASLLMATVAQVNIPLPFTPVPVTLSSLAVFLIGAALGPRKGALALMAYLAEGCAGLPVFAGGAAGAAVLIGPRGGYLVGFVVAAWVAGWMSERGGCRSFGRVAVAMVVAHACIYAVGLPWLGLYVGMANVVAMGLLPFVVGDLLKIVLAAGYFSRR